MSLCNLFDRLQASRAGDAGEVIDATSPERANTVTTENKN